MLCLIFLTFWLPGVSSLALADPETSSGWHCQAQHLPPSALPDGQKQDTMPPVPNLQALLRTRNLGSHPSCTEIAVKAFFFFPQCYLHLAMVALQPNKSCRTPAIVRAPVKPLGLFWGRCLQADNSLQHPGQILLEAEVTRFSHIFLQLNHSSV